MTIDCDLTEDDFLARFKPVPNPIDPSAGFDGCLFETFGEDLAYDPNLVWTVLDGDGQLAIASGFHFENLTEPDGDPGGAV
jgi:hypothetical protein